MNVYLSIGSEYFCLAIHALQINRQCFKNTNTNKECTDLKKKKNHIFIHALDHCQTVSARPKKNLQIKTSLAIKTGDFLSIDGLNGSVYSGKHRTEEIKAEIKSDVKTFSEVL